MTSPSICVCLANADFETCCRAAEEYPLVEMRFDLTALPQEQVKQLLGGKTPVAAACREGRYSEEERLKLLVWAVERGAKYVDIEVEMPRESRKAIAESAKRNGCRIIISYHNFDLTPYQNELLSIMSRAVAMGADIIKIACMARCADDCLRIMSLYHSAASRPLTAFAMGDAGRVTRLAAPLLGAPFTYAAIASDAVSAAGQFTAAQMQDMYRIICPQKERRLT